MKIGGDVLRTFKTTVTRAMTCPFCKKIFVQKDGEGKCSCRQLASIAAEKEAAEKEVAEKEAAEKKGSKK